MWNFICEMIPISSKPSSSSMSRSISSTINERKAQAYALLCQFLDCFFLVLPNKENDHLFEFALDLRTCEDFWKIIQVKNSSLSISLSFTFIYYSWPLLPSLYKLSYHFQIGLMDKGSLISKRCIYIMKRVVDFSNGQSLGEEGKEIQIKKPWTKYDKMRNGRIYYPFLKKKIINLIDISDGIIRKRNCFQDSGDFSLHYLKIWTNSLSMSFRYYNLSPSLSLSFTLFFKKKNNK